MEDNMNFFRKEWIAQKAPQQIGYEMIGGKVADQIEQLDQKLRKENRWIIISFSITLPILITMASLLPAQPLLFYVGMAGLYFQLSIFMAFFVNRRLKKSRTATVSDSQSFVASTISQLKYNKQITDKYMPFYALFLVLFISLMQIGVFSTTTIPLSLKVSMPIIVALLLGLVFWAGIRRKKEKDALEIDPMIEDLEALAVQLKA
ncbi:MAG: hypothetical protein AAF990_04295 [Bacteroidota bacterium]